MARTRRHEEPGEREGPLKGLAKDLFVAFVIILVVLLTISAYTQVWPPLVVVESESMQHGDSESYVGVIDTGDLVFVQAAPSRRDVVTYVEGRATGYSTYGDYGDVIVFRIARVPSATPIIHRAILYLIPNGTDAADVPDLAKLPTSDWEGVDRSGATTHSPFGLTYVTIRRMGYLRDLTIIFELTTFLAYRRAGYVTMGDNNAYDACFLRRDPCEGRTPYDVSWFPAQGDIIGRARGEIPWFGLIKLLVSPATSCCQGWGDSNAPRNSWDSLALALVAVFAAPFLVEGFAWVWSTYIGPKFGPPKGKDSGGPEGDSEDGA